MPQLDVPGGSLYFETDGEPGTPPLLLIHAGVATLRMWDAQIAALAEHHYVVRYDTRGFGQTETTATPFSDVLDAVAVIDHLGLASVTVIGASRGGRIALDLALDAADRVRAVAVVCSNPSGFEGESTVLEKALFDELDDLEASQQWEKLLRREVDLWDFGPLRKPEDLDPVFVARAYELALENIEHGTVQAVPIPVEPPAFGRVDAITVPALVTIGRFDISEMLQAYEYLLATLPFASGHVFESAAHLPSVEVAEEFERVLLDWLGEHAL